MDCELDFAQKSFSVFVLDSNDIALKDGVKGFCSNPSLFILGGAVQASAWIDRKQHRKYPIRILVSGLRFEAAASTSIESYQYIKLLSHSL
jgi:hypothetical protein